MKTNQIIAIVALIATTGFALGVGQAQQVGARRIDLQRHEKTEIGTRPNLASLKQIRRVS